MARVYLGRLPRDIRESEVEKLFRNYGEIRSILLKQGYGFVQFRDFKDAEDACRDFNGRDFMGDRIVVELAKGQERRPPPRDNFTKYERPRSTQYRVRIENLESSLSWQDLKDFMRTAGDCTYVDVRGSSGVADFATYDDMKNAIRKLNDTEYHGRREYSRNDRRSRSPRGRRSPDRRYSPRRSPDRRRASPRRSPERRRSPDRSYRSRDTYRRSPSPRRSPPRRERSKTRSPSVHEESRYEANNGDMEMEQGDLV